jgi:hypothetical protein
MRSRIAVESPSLSPKYSLILTLILTLGLLLALAVSPGCTFYGNRPARAFADATGGEALEHVFWNQVKAANWVEIERILASNYLGVASAGTAGSSGSMDRGAALSQYRNWQLKDYAIGDMKTELNGSTLIVTYSITLTGTAGSQPLPSAPQQMMTVWQQQKSGWMVIAHSVSQQPIQQQ